MSSISLFISSCEIHCTYMKAMKSHKNQILCRLLRKLKRSWENVRIKQFHFFQLKKITTCCSLRHAKNRIILLELPNIQWNENKCSTFRANFWKWSPDYKWFNAGEQVKGFPPWFHLPPSLSHCSWRRSKGQKERGFASPLHSTVRRSKNEVARASFNSIEVGLVSSRDGMNQFPEKIRDFGELQTGSKKLVKIQNLFTFI